MKKILLMMVLAALVFAGCSKDDDGGEKDTILKNTSWTAVDDIAEFLYGKTCTTTIEFIDNSTCQTIDKRIGMKYGAGTFINAGTYTIKADSVFWTVVDGGDISNMKAKISGSVLQSSMGTMAGGKRVYNKK